MDVTAEKFFKISLDLLVIGTLDGRFIRISPAWTKTLGWSEEELKRMLVPELIHPDDLQRTMEVTVEAVNGGRVFNFENRYRHKDGSWRRLLWTGLFSHDDDMFYGIAKDITKLMAMEDRLAQSERRLAEAQRIANLGSWELDLHDLNDVNRNPLTWSDQVFRIFGYEPGEIEVSNDNFFKAVHPDDREKIAAAVGKALQTGENYDLEHRIVLPDGTERIVHELSKVVMDPKTGKAASMFGTVQDITEQKRLMNQLTATQRIESIGRLTGGIAHDFNNLLAAIYGNLELMERQLEEEHSAYRYMKNIKSAARRAADLTSRLLAFSRQKILSPGIHDLNALVNEGHKILARILGEDIEIQLHLNERMGLIEVDASQVIQIILNLAINARDAMPHGGKLTIETSEVVRENIAYARLMITDTGHGMEKQIIEKIFEPFFTTKDPAGGTGLGLSTVYGIVKQSGGFITVDSQVGKGSSFEVLLPITDKAVSSRIKSFTPEKKVAPEGQGQTVFLVEDEDDLRTILQETFERSGYRVLTAANGKTASEFIQKQAQAIDLMVTDVVLPGAHGFELIKQMRTLHPKVPIICMSGYPSKDLDSGCDLTTVTFLPKPFLFNDLLEKARALLI